MQTDAEQNEFQAEEGHVEVVTDGALVAITRGEIGAQVETAKRFPRSLTKFEQRLSNMALYSKEVAEGMFYTLERKSQDGGKTLIIGPSIRLAEAAAQAYTNLRCGARVIGEDDRFITTQGVAHDIENNVFVSIENRRRITTKTGKKFGDDMIGVTSNASCSIALRNAIMRLVPRPIVEKMVKECIKIAKGDGKDTATKVKIWVDFWAKHKITVEDICKRFEVAGVADLTADHCVMMKGFQNRLSAEEATPEELFAVDRKAATVNKPAQTGNGGAPQGQGATGTQTGGTQTPANDTKKADATNNAFGLLCARIAEAKLDVPQVYHWLRRNEYVPELDTITLDEIGKHVPPKIAESLFQNFNAIEGDVREAMSEDEEKKKFEAARDQANANLEAAKNQAPANVVEMPKETEPAKEPNKPAEPLDESPLGMLRTKTREAGLTEAQVVQWAREAKKIAAGVTTLDGIIETSPSVVNYMVNNFQKIAKAIAGK